MAEKWSKVTLQSDDWVVDRSSCPDKENDGEIPHTHEACCAKVAAQRRGEREHHAAAARARRHSGFDPREQFSGGTPPKGTPPKGGTPARRPRIDTV